MLDEIRYTLAAALFCLGLYLCVDLFLSGFNPFVCGGAIACFVLTHYVKPANSGEMGWSFLDMLDFLIDFPFQAIAFALRALSKPLLELIDF